MSLFRESCSFTPIPSSLFVVIVVVVVRRLLFCFFFASLYLSLFLPPWSSCFRIGSSHIFTSLAYLICSVFYSVLSLSLSSDPNVGQYEGNPQDNKSFSKGAMIVVIACSSFLILLLLLIIFILYRRKKRYGGFFIFTLPPSPDYIMKLDPESSLLEQVNKLPYDAQWEFPRERLSVGTCSVCCYHCK